MFKSKDRIVLSTEPIFPRCRQNDTPDCKFVMVKKTLCLAMTARPVSEPKMLDPSSVA